MCRTGFFPETIRSGFLRHPYLTGDHIPNQRIIKKPQKCQKGDAATISDWKLNARGCRDDADYLVEKHGSTSRWICLVGSALVVGSSNQRSILALLREILKQQNPQGEKGLEVFNFGRVGWDSTSPDISHCLVIVLQAVAAIADRGYNLVKYAG